MDNNLGDILSSIMNDSDLINKIKDTVKSNDNSGTLPLESVISLITPKLSESKKNDNTQNNPNEGIDNSSASSNTTFDKLSSLSFIGSISETISKNSPLLLALKPYLSKDRCDIIDSVVKISQITDALKLL